MRKFTCILLLTILLVALAVSCACSPKPNPPAEIADEEKVSTLMEKPDGATPATVSAKESLYIAAAQLKNSGGFRGEATGKSTAVLGIEQQISAQRTVVGENVFKQSVTFSTFMKSGTQLFVSGGNYLERSSQKVRSLDDVDWSDSAVRYSQSGWEQRIGYVPNGLTGYILNDFTIVDAQLQSNENGLFTFHYVLDTEKAPYFLLYEMRTNAGSDNFAVFSKAEIVVVMDSNFVVKTLTTDCEYKASAMGLSNVPCSESITETFYDIGYNGDLPQKNFFEKFFDASAVDQVGEKEVGAAEVLTAMMSPYLLDGETLNLAADVQWNNASLCTAKVALSLGESASDIALRANVGDLFVTYANNQLLIDFEDFHAAVPAQELDALLGLFANASIDAEQLLASATLEEKNGVARVKLPLDIGGMQLAIDLFAAIEQDTYTFVRARVTAANLKIDLALTESWQGANYNGEYLPVCGIADLLRGVAFDTTIAGNEFTIAADLLASEVYVTSDVVSAAIANNTLFAQVGNAKVQISLDSAQQVVAYLQQMFAPVDALQGVSMDTLLALLGNVTAQQTDDGVVLCAQLPQLGSAKILLVAGDCWSVHSVVLDLQGTQLTLVPQKQFEKPTIVASEYTDISPIANTLVPVVAQLLRSDSLQLDLSAEIGHYSLQSDIRIQQGETGNAFAIEFCLQKQSQQLLGANIVLAEDTLFLTVGNFRYAVAAEKIASGEVDLSSSLQIPFEVENQVVATLLDTVQNVVAQIEQGTDIWNIAGSLQSITLQDGVLCVQAEQLFGIDGTVTLQATDGLNVGVQLTANDLQVCAQVGAKVLAQPIDCPDISLFCTDIVQLLTSQNYLANLQGQVVAENTYTFSAVVLCDSLSKLHLQLQLAVDGVAAIDGEIWLADGMVMGEIDGLRFAANTDAANMASLQSVANNPYVSKVLQLVEQLQTVQLHQLVSKVVLADDCLELWLQTGGKICIGLDNGIVVSAQDIALQGVQANATLNLATTTDTVQLPQGDWSTNVAIALDSHNTLFANLNFVDGEFNFKLENDLPLADGAAKDALFVRYTTADNTLLVKNGDVKASCNVSEFSDIVDHLDALVKQFAGQSAAASIALPSVAALLQNLSFEVVADTQNNTVALSVCSDALQATVKIDGNAALLQSANIQFAGTSLVVYLCDKFDFADFSDRENYVALDTVLRDYIPTLENLVNTHGWQFVFESDGQIDVKDSQGVATNYKIVAGSYLKLFFDAANKQDTMLRAKITLQKLANGGWEDFVTVDAALIDGRIFVTYNNTLKATISLQAIADCSSVFEQLKQTIPQLGQLLENLNDAKEDAAEADFTQLIRSISYTSQGEFSIALCGNALMDKLGDVEISLCHTENSITLKRLALCYGNVSVTLNDVTCTASEKTEDGSYTVAQEIANYTTQWGGQESHMNFDSLKQLLGALTDTAKQNTFAIDGTISANIAGLYSVDMGVAVRVDCVDDNVFVSALITREDKIVFEDDGGYSYIFFNPTTGMIDVVRNSRRSYTWCSKCNGFGCSNFWHIAYHSKKQMLETEFGGSAGYHVTVTAEEFAQNAVTYILELVNLSGTVEKLITDNISSSGSETSQQIAIEKLLKNYTYTVAEESRFDVVLDLSAVDKNMGQLNLAVMHTTDVANNTETLRLTKLQASVTLADVVELSANMVLDAEPVFGDAHYFVSNTTLWKQGDHAPQA